MKLDRTKTLEAAQRFAAKGQFDKAIGEYEKITAMDSRDIRTLLKVGDLYARKGDPQGAIRSYGKVAEQYSSQGFFLKAIAVYKQMLKLEPGRIDISMRLAEMYKKLALVTDALSTYEHVAVLHFERGEHAEALRALALMVDLDPTNIPVRIKYAEALSQSENPLAAAEQFEAGAQLLKEQNRIDDYLKVCERLLYHRSDDTALAREIAALYLKRQQPKMALGKLQLCFSKEPHNVGILELLAQAFDQLGQTAKAVSVYKEIARLHRDAGRMQDHATILQRILELDPRDDDSRQALAGYAPSAARSVAPRVNDTDVSQEPEPEVMEIDEAELVEEDLVEMLSDPPSQSLPPDIAREAKIARLLTECKVYESYGLQKEVTKQLLRVLELAPDNMEAREKLKEIYLSTGLFHEAQEQLQQLARIVSTTDPARAARYQARASEIGEPPPGNFALEEGTDRTQQEMVRFHAERARRQPPKAVSKAPNISGFSNNHSGSLLRPISPSEFDALPLRRTQSLAASASSQPASLRVEQALDEAEFFLVQGLLEETEQVLTELLETFPGHPLVEAKMEELKAAAAQMQDDGPEITIEEGDQSFMLAEKLAEELGGSGAFHNEVIDVESVFAQFKEGVKAQLSNEDTETHFDLGIAYKEMGLFDDAIEEFRLCLNNPARECNASTMIGICFKENNQLTEAIKNFKRGLHAENKSPEEEIGLYYELGSAYETLGDISEALYFFEEVRKRNNNYRDTANKIKELKRSAG